MRVGGPRRNLLRPMQSRRREIERRLSRPLILCYDMRRAAPVAAGQATSISHVFSVERMAVPSFWGRLFSWPDVQTKGYRRDDKCHKVDHGADNLVIAHRLTSNSRRRWPPSVSSRIARLPSVALARPRPQGERRRVEDSGDRDARRDPAPHALLHDVLHRDLAVNNGPCEPTLSKHPCDGKNGIGVNP